MGNTDCKPTAYDNAETRKEEMEFVRIGYNIQNHADVLCQSLHFL